MKASKPCASVRAKRSGMRGGRANTTPTADGPFGARGVLLTWTAADTSAKLLITLVQIDVRVVHGARPFCRGATCPNWELKVPLERGTHSAIDVLDRVLDKGIVVDYWARVSVLGIDILTTIEARIVVASLDTYL